MLYETDNIRVEADRGIATLWLDFPGRRPNRLNLLRILAIGRAIEIVAQNPCLEILVVRSAKPSGFCAGYDFDALAELKTDAECRDFAATGERVLRQLREAAFVSLAMIQGPCLGPGLELALSCDYRFAIANPTTEIGFSEFAATVPPCWGEWPFTGELFSAREAHARGIVDHVCTERRAKIDLRTVLDDLQQCPRKRRATPPCHISLRCTFAAAMLNSDTSAAIARAAQQQEYFELPQRVHFIGEHASFARRIADYAIRGVEVYCDSIEPDFYEVVCHGLATPLEITDARKRIRNGRIEHPLATDYIVNAHLVKVESVRAVA